MRLEWLAINDSKKDPEERIQYSGHLKELNINFEIPKIDGPIKVESEKDVSDLPEPVIKVIIEAELTGFINLPKNYKDINGFLLLSHDDPKVTPQKRDAIPVLGITEKHWEEFHDFEWEMRQFKKLTVSYWDEERVTFYDSDKQAD